MAFKMETFTILLILKKSLGVIILISMLIWLQKYREGFGWQSTPELQFNWHPILAVAGMIILYGNAILTFRMLRNIKKFTAKVIHGSFNLIGFIFIVISLKAVFDSHNYAPTPIPNLYSLHSWVGLISVIMFASQWVCGFLIFLYPGANLAVRANYHPFHIYFGMIGFACATCSALLGFVEKAYFSIENYRVLPPEAVLVNTIGLMLLVYSSLVLYMTMEPKYRRQVLSEDQNLLSPKQSAPGADIPETKTK